MTTIDHKNKIIKNCLKNAESLIASAEELAEKRGRRHVAYTLAALGLEEVGKASILKSMFAIEESGIEPLREVNMGMDDHVRKLFWAIWGASFTKEKITQDSSNQYKGIANDIHTKRLEYLYADISNSNRPTIRKEELDNIVRLARARLMMEKSYGLLNRLDGEKARRMKWFLESSQDSEMRKLIFGNPSIRKLEELKDSTDWINWMYEQFQEADKDSQKLLQQEMLRKKPEGNDVSKDKWEV